MMDHDGDGDNDDDSGGGDGSGSGSGSGDDDAADDDDDDDDDEDDDDDDTSNKNNNKEKKQTTKHDKGHITTMKGVTTVEKEVEVEVGIVTDAMINNYPRCLGSLHYIILFYHTLIPTLSILLTLL